MAGTWDAIVRKVLDDARRAAGGGAALALALKNSGVGPETGTYSESAVSNWIKGRTRPPADVVLAAASLHGIPLDPLLGTLSRSSPAEPGVRTGTSELEDLRAGLTRLEAVVNARLRGRGSAQEASVKDLVGVYSTRSEFQSAAPLLRTLANAQRVDLMGLSLNGICQGISDVTLTELVENGLHLRCLFLDPDGDSVPAREEEEGLPAKHLSEITRTNLLALTRLRDGLSPGAADRVEIRAYDETLRFNITIADGERAYVQPYLAHLRGLDSPTFVIESNDTEPHGLYPVFAGVFEDAWKAGSVVRA